MDRKTILMQYVQDELMKGRTMEMNPEEDLLSSGILDSLGILQLVSFIDKQFNIQVPDEDVVFENFQSIKALSEYLAKLKT